MKIFRTLTIVLALLYLASLLWLQFHHLVFYRRTVLEVPVRFEEGFSLKRPFTVDMPETYWVAIQYDEIFRSTVEIPVPRDEFTADFEVTSKDHLITKGGTASFPDWTGPWSNNGDHVTRYLNSFRAEPRVPYQVSLRIMSAQPRLLGKHPKAIVEIRSGFDEFIQLRIFLLVSAGAVIGILVLFERLLAHRIRSLKMPRPVE